MTTQAQTATIQDSPRAQRWVYDFAEGSREMRDLGLDYVSCSRFRLPIAAPRQTRI